VLTLRSGVAPAADGKIHANGVVALSVTVAGGSPPSVELALVDEARLQLVGPPGYSYAWDTATAAPGSHRVIATTKGGTRTYSSQSIEVVVDHSAPSTPVVTAPASPTNADIVVLTGTAEEKSRIRVLEGTAELAGADVLNGGTWSVELKGLAPGRHELAVKSTDVAGNASAPASVTLVVDRTRPTIVARSPSPGVVDYDVRSPITITFSEPMANGTERTGPPRRQTCRSVESSTRRRPRWTLRETSSSRGPSRVWAAE
jgi:hypothetical protein